MAVNIIWASLNLLKEQDKSPKKKKTEEILIRKPYY